MNVPLRQLVVYVAQHLKHMPNCQHRRMSHKVPADRGVKQVADAYPDLLLVQLSFTLLVLQVSIALQARLHVRQLSMHGNSPLE